MTGWPPQNIEGRERGLLALLQTGHGRPPRQEHTCAKYDVGTARKSEIFALSKPHIKVVVEERRTVIGSMR